MEDLKDRLKKALNSKGWTGADLARASGVNKSEVSRYLHGQVVPKQTKIGKMAEALGVSPAWLLGFDSVPEKSLELDKLTETNKARLFAYYDALIDSQGGENGDA